MAAAETHKGDHDWGLWKGTVANIAEVARTAERLVRQIPGGLPHVFIEVSREGVDSEFPNPDAFEAGLAEEDLARISRIEVLATEGIPAPSRVSVVFSRRNGVELRVRGSDAMWVRGTTAQMRDLIGEHHVWWMERVTNIAGLVGFLLMIGLSAGVYALPEDGEGDVSLTWRIVLGVLVCLAAFGVIFYVVRRYAMPAVLIQPAGGQSRSRRVQPFLWRGVGALVLLVAGAFINEFVHKLFD